VGQTKNFIPGKNPYLYLDISRLRHNIPKDKEQDIGYLGTIRIQMNMLCICVRLGRRYNLEDNLIKFSKEYQRDSLLSQTRSLPNVF